MDNNTQPKSTVDSTTLVPVDIGKIRSGEYTAVEYSKDSLEYYLITQLKIAIPVCKDSNKLLLQACCDMGDLHMSQELGDYPRIQHNHMVAHFPEYELLAVLRKVTKCKPVKLFSGWEQGILERRRMAQAEMQSHANKQARQAELESRTTVLDFSDVLGGVNPPAPQPDIEVTPPAELLHHAAVISVRTTLTALHVDTATIDSFVERGTQGLLDTAKDMLLYDMLTDEQQQEWVVVCNLYEEYKTKQEVTSGQQS